jgi:UDP-2-acetamido-3-amino-2,3-dideoxy-glucuronate N-acetyltransferase
MSISEGAFLHDTVHIDGDVAIGKGTKIWHFSHVLKNVSIGEDCSFGQNCCVGPNVTIGNNVKVQNNVSIYDGVECEDDVFLGPSMVFTNISTPRSFINRKEEFARTLIKKGASVGANATIVCGVTIGEYALVGAGTVVTKDVKPYALVYGVPARQKGWVGQSGNKLVFDKSNLAIDPEDNKRYRLQNDYVTREEA